jgi:plasmid stabilization system protein ParE
VSDYRLVSTLEADHEIESAFLWYEKELAGLGHEFLEELRKTYNQIVDGPLKYPKLRSNTRRALLKRFPYAVYFVIDSETIVVLAVFHTSRDPVQWQRRSR